MFRVWQMIHPMRALTLMYIFLALLAFTIHFILLSTGSLQLASGLGCTKRLDHD